MRFPNLSLVALGTAVLLTANAALAVDPHSKRECLSAYEQSQRLRQDSSLRQAREQTLLCAREVCPAEIKKDCQQWNQEIDRMIPSVILEALDAEGKQLSDVRVLFDGKPLVDKLDQKPVNVDPGWHQLRFEPTTGDAVEERVLLREGEQRKVTVRLGGKGSAKPEASVKAEASDPSRPVPALVYVLGGVAAVGFGGFAWFALKGKSQQDDLESCRPNCDRDAAETMHRNYVIGDVFAAVGVLSLGAATYLFVTRPSAETAPSATATTWINVAPVTGGAAAALHGVF